MPCILEEARLNSIILGNLCLNPSICMLMQPIDRISGFTSPSTFFLITSLQNALGFFSFTNQHHHVLPATGNETFGYIPY